MMRTKKLSRFLATLIAVVTMLSLVGCTKTVTETHTDENGNTVTTTTVTDKNGTTVTETTDAVEEDVEEGAYASLQDYYSVEENFNAVVEEMQELYNENSDVFDDIAFNCSGNSFEYVYTLVELDDEGIDAFVENRVEYFDEIDDEKLIEAKEAVIGDSGIAYDDVELSFVYNSFDGEEIYRITY